MAFDYPASPTVGQTYTPVAGTTYTWNGYAWDLVSLNADVFTTGDVKFTLKTVADPGWLMFNDGSIGSASSGSSYAAADAQNLFNLLFANTNDTNCPIQTSSGGATTRAAQGTAAAAWAANCRMLLPKTLGRALAMAGSGAGLTARTLAQTAGAESDTPTNAKMFAHTHQSSTGASYPLISLSPTGGYMGPSGGMQGAGITTEGVSSPVPIVQPTTFLNVMVKL